MAGLTETHHAVIPRPASIEKRGDAPFALTPDTHIVAAAAGEEATAVADHLAALLRRATGYPVPVHRGTARPRPAILLALDSHRRLGAEGYRLRVARNAVQLEAKTSEGLFRAVQTLRQLLPATVESASTQSGPWTIPAVSVADRPRFGWRGAHLDVSRRFFSLAEVKRYIDLVCQYKINVLHLHLSDDQGWRIVVDRWPRLATHGGSSAVGGGPGGYYTKLDYREIVRYAAARYVTVVPEIDTPGHTGAALASYPELNCDGRSPPLYTGVDVGFSSLCVEKEITYEFLDDVVRELAEITPGRYLHLGGDEARATADADYVRFIDRLRPIVRRHGKRMMGWEEMARARLAPGTLVQYWSPATGSEPGTAPARRAVEQGLKLVMSPANHAYLDMKYDRGTPVGLSWAGYVDARDAHDWDPAELIDGVGEKDVAGVESALWTETIADLKDAEFMTFPRLPGIAEVGWSPRAGHDWEDYRRRLAAHGPRWEAQRVNFYRSAQVPWP